MHRLACPGVPVLPSCHKSCTINTVLTGLPLRVAGAGARTPQQADKTLVISYQWSSDRNTPLHQRVEDAVQAAGDTPAADGPRLRFGSTRQDHPSQAVGRIVAAAERADAAAAAAAVQEESDDDGLLDFGGSGAKQQKKQQPTKQQQRQPRQQPAWWQQQPTEPGAAYKSPAAAAVRFGRVDKPAAAAVQDDADAVPQQQQEQEQHRQEQPQRQQVQQQRQDKLPGTPPSHLESVVKVGTSPRAVAAFTKALVSS